MCNWWEKKREPLVCPPYCLDLDRLYSENTSLYSIQQNQLKPKQNHLPIQNNKLPSAASNHAICHCTKKGINKSVYIYIFSARSGAVLTGTQYRHFCILLQSVPARFLAYRYFSHVAGTLPLTKKESVSRPFHIYSVCNAYSMHAELIFFPHPY